MSASEAQRHSQNESDSWISGILKGHRQPEGRPGGGEAEAVELVAIKELLGRIVSGLDAERERLVGPRTVDQRIADFLGCSKADVQSHEASFPDGDGAVFAVQCLLDHTPRGWRFDVLNFHRYDESQVVSVPRIEVAIGYESHCYCISGGYVFAQTPICNWVLSVGEKQMFSRARPLTVFVAAPDAAKVEQVLAHIHETLRLCSRFKNRKLTIGADGPRFLEPPAVAWSEVFLEPHVMEEIEKNVIRPMRKPRLWRAAGLPTRRSMLLSGPPGTGKSQIGRLLASQLRATFVVVTTEGIGDASDVREVYRLARENRPTVLFFEDLDVVASREGGGSRVFGELLAQMDGFECNDQIITLATTNRPEVLDEALKDRPGRFDRHIVVDLPNEVLREGLFRHFLALSEIRCDDATLRNLVARSRGMSGAHIREMVVTAAIEAHVAGLPESGSIWPLDRFVEAARKLEKVRSQVGFKTS
ncbi:MAG: ATP-binding protein [Candidatus Eisenbacteria bacterium]|uniref:ATP-binding protein n=1 Tax=Eiseniibacteriota bacterium TaxID=2212470 RepID=A0A956NHU5_UNCEI|nr:ATP-binding protein [Candidatus Eisenbacteria bacterium]